MGITVDGSNAVPQLPRYIGKVKSEDLLEISLRGGGGEKFIIRQIWMKNP